jgi:hypothetical protein
MMMLISKPFSHYHMQIGTVTRILTPYQKQTYTLRKSNVTMTDKTNMFTKGMNSNKEYWKKLLVYLHLVFRAFF